MIICVTRYAITNPHFMTKAPSNAAILVARFVASMQMHIFVEKDI